MTDPDRQWTVYMLECADDTFYVGITNDMARRLNEHNTGSASRYTRGRRPVHVVMTESATSRSAALKREAALKRLTRAQKERLL